MFKGIIVAGVVGVMISATPAQMWGEEEPDVTVLQEVKVSAPAKTRVELLPLNVTVVNDSVIENSAESSLLPVLTDRVAGLFTSERGFAGYGVSGGAAGTVNIRGVGQGNKVLFMIDGQPQWAAVFGHALPDTYVANGVERVEVVKGPSSLLYGSNAMGGSVNIITRKAERDGLYGRARAMFGSFNTQKLNLSTGYRKGKFGIEAAGQLDRSNGNRAGSAFWLANEMVSMSYGVSDNWSTGAVLDLTQTHANNPGTLQSPLESMWTYMGRGAASVYAHDRYAWGEGGVQAYINWGHHNVDDGHAPGAEARNYLFHSNDYNMGVTLYQTMHWWQGNDLSVGLDYVHWGGHTWNTLKDEVKTREEGARKCVNDVAGYVMMQQAFWGNLLDVNAGVRLQHSGQFGNEWVPQAGFILRPLAGSMVKFNFGKGFRAPNLRELYMYPPHNPLYNATLSSFSTSRNQTLRNTVDAKWYVTKDFYVSGQFNIDVKSSQSDKYVSPDDAQFLGENDPAKRGLYGLGTGKAFNYDGKIVLNYGRNIGQEGSGFVINAGSDIQHTNATTSYITAMGFLKDNLSDIKYALGYDSSNLPSGTETLLAKVGFFASGNIYFRNRYFADVSYRTSGSSAYGKENRFAPMWSFGLGWNLHKEKFLENVEWIDVIRLKWSWGYNGQTTGSPYQAITTYKYSNSNIYYTGVGTVPIRMGNPELKWQRVLKNNFGINLTLFKERLVMSFDYFRNTTKDQLMTIPLPASTGSEDIVVNFGENQNVGYDFSVAGQVIRNKNWAWTSVINGSHVKDRIKQISDKLKNTAYQLEEDNPLKLRFREGGSQYDIYAVRSAGIDPATGQEIFINKNGEYTFKYDAEDEVVVGNTQPKLQGTWLNTLRYKGWSLNFVFSYTFGGDTYNKTLWEKVEDIDPRYNVDERAFTDRWKNPGDLSRYLAIKERRSTTPHNSERFVERLNELWLSSATLTYEFQPKFLKRLGFKRLAVGVGVSDIGRFSTVKYERGTSYPYCRTINLTFRPTF